MSDAEGLVLRSNLFAFEIVNSQLCRSPASKGPIADGNRSFGVGVGSEDRSSIEDLPFLIRFISLNTVENLLF